MNDLYTYNNKNHLLGFLLFSIISYGLCFTANKYLFLLFLILYVIRYLIILKNAITINREWDKKMLKVVPNQDIYIKGSKKIIRFVNVISISYLILLMLILIYRYEFLVALLR